MSDHRTCRQPDRDQPKIICGYPIPCPWHTAIIHLEKTPPTVEVPIDVDAGSRARLGDVARALSQMTYEDAPAAPKKKRRTKR